MACSAWGVGLVEAAAGVAGAGASAGFLEEDVEEKEEEDEEDEESAAGAGWADFPEEVEEDAATEVVLVSAAGGGRTGFFDKDVEEEEEEEAAAKADFLEEEGRAARVLPGLALFCLELPPVEGARCSPLSCPFSLEEASPPDGVSLCMCSEVSKKRR